MSHKLETEFATKFGLWIMMIENKPSYPQNYEFKVTNGGTFNLKTWRNNQPHQPRSLKQASGSHGVYHKISDMSMGTKPFDAIFSRDTESLLVIWFNKYEEFFMIPVQDVPPTDSISYDYCLDNFTKRKLLIEEKIPITDF